MDGGFRFWAFISYSHKDAPVANWLHSKLERYRVPRRLIGRATSVGTVPARLFPIFKDREELPVSASLDENIQQALRESRFLIVICTPSAAQSHWVNEEIRYFKSLGREARVLSLIAGGEPNAVNKGLPDTEECFPPALRNKVDEEGRITDQRVEPIAADIRDSRDGRRLSVLKLTAGILGVNFDELRQRERTRRAQTIGVWSLGAAVLATILATLVVQGGREKGARILADRQLVTEKVKVSAKESDRKLAEGLRLIDEGDFESGVASIAKSLRHNPDNQAAVAALTWTLTERPFPIRKSLPSDSKRPESKSVSSSEEYKISPDGTYRVEEIGREIHIRNLKTNEVDRRPYQSDYASTFTFSSDEKFLFADSPAGESFLWNLTHRKLVATYRGSEFFGGLFSTNAHNLFVSNGRSGILYDLANVPVASAPYRLPDKQATESAEWFDGTTFVSKEGTQVVGYDLLFRPLLRVDLPDTLEVRFIHRPFTGHYLLLEAPTRSDDYTSDWILNLKTGQRNFVYGHQDTFIGSISSSGIATREMNVPRGDLRLFDFEANLPLTPVLVGDAFYPLNGGQGLFAVSGSSVTLYRPKLPQVSYEDDGDVRGVESSPDGSMAVCQLEDADAQILTIGDEIALKSTLPASDGCQAFFWMNDGQHILGIDFEANESLLWNATTGELADLASFPNIELDSSSYFSQRHSAQPDRELGGQVVSRNQIIITQKVSREVDAPPPAIFNLIDESFEPLTLQHPEASPVIKGAVTFDGRLAASLDEEGHCYLWDVKKRQRIVKMPGKVVDIAFSPDSRFALILESTGIQNRYLGLVGRDDIPAWLPELAEILANRRLDENDTPIALTETQARQDKLTEAIGKEPADSEWRIFAEAVLGIKPEGLAEEFR